MKRRTFLKALAAALAAPAVAEAVVEAAAAPAAPAAAVDLQTRTVGAFTTVSRRHLRQANGELEKWIREELATTMAREIDRALLEGEWPWPDGWQARELHHFEVGLPDFTVSPFEGDMVQVTGRQTVSPTWRQVVRDPEA